MIQAEYIPSVGSGSCRLDLIFASDTATVYAELNLINHVARINGTLNSHRTINISSFLLKVGACKVYKQKLY